MQLYLVVLFLIISSMVTKAEETIELEQISITGQRDDLTIRRDAATQKVIVERAEIESLGVSTIGEVLSRLPGIELKGGVNRARGMSRDSIQILIDGERQVGGTSGMLQRLPAEQLDRVEILRGSSAEFGGASALTVNLISKKALPKRSTAFKFGLGKRGNEPNSEFSWTENGGSENFAWSLPFTSNLRHSPINSSTIRQFSSAGIDSFWQEEQARGVSKLGTHMFSPRFTWKDGLDNLTVSPMFFYGPTDISSQTNVTPNIDPVSGGGFVNLGNRNLRETGTQRLWRLRAEGMKFTKHGKLSGHMAFNKGKNDVDTKRDIRGATNFLTRLEESTLTTNHEFNTALRWDQSIVDTHFLSSGMEFVKVRREDTQLFVGGLASAGDFRASSRDTILWLQDDWTPEDSFTLTTGLRLENMSIASDNVSQTLTGLLPSIAIRWQPNERWVLRTSLGAGMKMPKLDEISNATIRSLGPNTPVEADRRGNPNLTPERNINFEAVVEHYLPKSLGVFGANIYLRATNDFIERRVQQEGIRWVDRPFNEGDAIHYGIELDAKVKMDSFGWTGATLKSHLTLPYGRVDDERLGTTRMARDTPHYILNMGLEQSLPKFKTTYGITAVISGRSETSIPNEQRGFTESITMLDAYLRYKLSPTYNIRFTARNLLKADTRMQNRFIQGISDWQLATDENVMRRFMVSLEGQW
jgi:outer membrane receptor for ferrienterochelin and colicins